MRASDRLSNGVVVALECVARTEDGDPIASRVMLLHVRGNMARPSTRAAARAIAARAIEACPHTSGTVPGLADWVEKATQIHQRSIDNRLAREAALLHRASANVAVQPGLFDRRALREADELSERERAIHAEHRRRIAALERARRGHLSSTPIAVLIVWR